MVLAESLLNLSTCVGFADKVRIVKSLATLAECENEMWAASTIGRVGIPLRFIPQESSKTLDVALCDDHGSDVARVEFKAKDPSHDFADAITKIRRSIRAALEKTSPVPRMVFVRLPPEWMRQPFIQLTFQTACGEFLENYADVCLFVAHGELTLEEAANDWGIAGQPVITLVNPCFRTWTPLLATYVDRLTGRAVSVESDWVRIDQLCARYLPR